MGKPTETGISTVILPSASRATTTLSAPQRISNATGVAIVVDVTTIGTGSITVSIRGRFPVGGEGPFKTYNILSSAAIVGNGTTVLTVDPRIPSVANVSAQAILPFEWEVNVVANNANPVVYSVAALAV